MASKMTDIELPVGIILQATSGYCNYKIGLSDVSENDTNRIQYNIARDFNIISNYDINVYRSIDVDIIGNSAIEIKDDAVTKTAFHNFYNPIIAITSLESEIEADFRVVYKDVEDISEKDINISICTELADIDNNIFSDETITFNQLWGFSTIDFTKNYLFVTGIGDNYYINLIEYGVSEELGYFYIKSNGKFTYTQKTKSEMTLIPYVVIGLSTINFEIDGNDITNTIDGIEDDIIFNMEIDDSLNHVNNYVGGKKYVVNYNSNFLRYYDNFENVKSDFESIAYYNRVDKNINIFNMYKEDRKYNSTAGLVLGMTLNKLFDEYLLYTDYESNISLLFDLKTDNKSYCEYMDYNFCFNKLGSMTIKSNSVVSKYKNLSKIMDNIAVSMIYDFFVDFINNNKVTVNDLYVYNKLENELNEYIDGVNNIEDITYEEIADKLVVTIKLYGVLEQVILNVDMDTANETITI